MDFKLSVVDKDNMMREQAIVCNYNVDYTVHSISFVIWDILSIVYNLTKRHIYVCIYVYIYRERETHITHFIRQKSLMNNG